MAVRSESIPKIKKYYQNEWLLFDVSKIDKQNHPLQGKLLAHSVSRNAVYEAWSKIKVKLPYLTYTGKRPKKGIVSVL